MNIFPTRWCHKLD